MYQCSDRTKTLYRKLRGFLRTKSLRKVEAHVWCPPPSYNLGRAASPPLPSRTLKPLCHSTFLTLLVTSSFLYYSFYQITLFSPFPLLHSILISWPSLVSYLLSRPSLLLQDCFHSTGAPPPLLRFNFWLPSSCPGSCIANPFFFSCLLHIYPVTYMLPPKPCLSLRPLSPSFKCLTLRIVTP